MYSKSQVLHDLFNLLQVDRKYSKNVKTVNCLVFLISLIPGLILVLMIKA